MTNLGNPVNSLETYLGIAVDNYCSVLDAIISSITSPTLVFLYLFESSFSVIYIVKYTKVERETYFYLATCYHNKYQSPINDHIMTVPACDATKIGNTKFKVNLAAT